jgi:phenylalanyl-tRNA synthetase alpha chain
MKNLEHQILELHNQLTDALQKVSNQDQLEQVRISFLSRNGLVAELMESIKKLSLEEKRTFGPRLNSFKQDAQKLFNEKKDFLEDQEKKAEQIRTKYFDVTAYQPGQLKGSLHPYTHLTEKIEDIFTTMGFQIADGPEVEADYYNFEALNIPEDHPARDMHDTFWLDVPGLLMRTHTSPVQIHAMEGSKPPIALIAPGRCYRHEAVDASHDFMFMQTEGMVIDKNISMGNLLATAQTVLQALFDKTDLKLRVRPGYFPFVEPGVELDMSCPFCTSGCSVCKKTGWIETGGAGLIHPNVLRMSGIDPDVYSGFAFGFGLTRLAMLTYGINDIRLLHSAKLEFLTQF